MARSQMDPDSWDDDGCTTRFADSEFEVSLGTRMIWGTGRPRRMSSPHSTLVAPDLVVQDLPCYLLQVEAGRTEPKGYLSLGLWHSNRRCLVAV